MALSRRLIEAALKRGVRTFIGIVLPENRKMLHLFKDLGLPERVRYDYEDGTDYVEIDLSPPQDTSDRRAGASGPQS
jgi:L-amino acid N-acyltransferase YncA